MVVTGIICFYWRRVSNMNKYEEAKRKANIALRKMYDEELFEVVNP